MALIDFSSRKDVSSSLVNGRVELRTPQYANFAEWRDLRETSRAHLTRWEPDWRAEDVTLLAYKNRVKG